MIPAFPLHWPAAWPRSKRPESSRFKTTLSAALKNVRDSIRMFGQDSGNPITDVVISSNVSLGHENPADTGVAVWFTWEGAQLCIAVDRYKKVQENLQAIHLIIESRRTELRHGGLHLIRQAFHGFKALPAPAGGCWQVLEIPETKDRNIIREKYEQLAKIHHPDKPGGDNDKFAEICAAYKEALKYAES